MGRGGVEVGGGMNGGQMREKAQPAEICLAKRLAADCAPLSPTLKTPQTELSNLIREGGQSRRSTSEVNERKS